MKRFRNRRGGRVGAAVETACLSVGRFAGGMGVLGSVLLASSALAGSRMERIRHWSSIESFDECTRDRYIDSLSKPGSVRLVSRILVADELGAGANNFQAVKGKIQARKMLMVENPDVTDALLLVDGLVNTCEILVNGTVLEAKPLPSTYLNQNFEHYEIPPSLLRAGANTFVFRARPDGRSNGRIRVERGRAIRSDVSRDGGHFWTSDRFCEPGYMEGELAVRLRLGRFAPAGQITSPVMDLASAVEQDGIACGREGRLDALDVDAVLPPGTGIRTFVRTGLTPDGYEENWGPWQVWPLPEGSMTFERFIQWRLELSTQDPRQTPVVRQVSMRWSAEGVQAGAGSVRVMEDGNETIVRSSYPFAYASPAGQSKVLREQWKLEDVIAGSDHEFEKLKVLRQWVRDQWTDGWNIGRFNYVPAWDARLILTLASENLSLGMCTHYAAVMVQSAQALGFPARPVFHGHALSEIWSNTHRKWVLMDAGGDTNDRRRSTYHYETNGTPLSLMEVHKASLDDAEFASIQVRETNQSGGAEPPYRATPEAMDAVRAERNPHNFSQIFIELRNHFMDHPEPVEPEHGMGYFKYLGHLFWKSSKTPEVTWTDFFTTREADLSWTLNQAQIYLLREAGDASALRVLLDTVTPGFAGYEIRFDDGEWIVWTGRQKVGPVEINAYPMHATGRCVEFVWKLNSGENRIEARPFNTSGIRGISSRMVVEMQP